MKPEIIIMLTHHDVTVKDAGEIFDRLLCASHIRLADYLKQRHSAAVAVDERAV